jgi:small neutral amino acid transporter SnatA (MarC family)
MKRIPKYKFYFIVSFIFLVIGIILIQKLPNTIPTLIIFGYFFLFYLGTGINLLIKQKKNANSPVNKTDDR